jgi:hypothetical protein
MMKFYQSPVLIISFLFFLYGIYLQFFGKGFDQLLELLVILLFFGWLLVKDKF